MSHELVECSACGELCELIEVCEDCGLCFDCCICEGAADLDDAEDEMLPYYWNR